MNRRVLLFVLLVGGVLALFLFVLPGRRTAPATDSAGSAADARGATTAPPAAAPPAAAPEPARPAPEPRTNNAPRRTPPARSPAAPAPAAPAPAADAAMLRIDADVPGAQVFVDRVFLGTTPLTTTDVKVGEHRLNVSAAGYEGIAQPLDVKPGMQQVLVKLREVRLSARIDVVHKHRMGSCAGSLVATPHGITYVTDNKNDGFRAPLLEIEDFRVDYLDKNLHLRVKGRSFDFTDPEDNADRLFVFHRDVTAARERIAKGDPPAAE